MFEAHSPVLIFVTSLLFSIAFESRKVSNEDFELLKVLGTGGKFTKHDSL